MNATKILAATALGLSAAACSSTTYETRTASTPYAASSSEQACANYGFRVGTDNYNRCVSREAAARAQGRVPVGYTVASLDADARNACYSYGLTVGSSMYNNCVAREIDARRYRDQAYVTPVPAPGPGYYPASTTTYYTTPPGAPTYYGPATTVTTTSYATPPAPAYQATPPAGVEAFRDEYGFRYDGQGNRLDRSGNIISPQSTTR